MRRSFVFCFPAAVLLVLSMALIGCSPKEEAKPETGTSGDQATSQVAISPGTAGGITWTVPAGWKPGPKKPMRAATYIIDPAEGDTDSAECAVFYFGPGSAGGKQANIDRWIGQFEQPDDSASADRAAVSEAEINGLKITTIDLTGTYNAAGGPMMQVKEKKAGYRLLGAIVEGPQGLVFFKLIGSDMTVTTSEGDFLELIPSIKKQTM